MEGFIKSLETESPENIIEREEEKLKKIKKRSKRKKTY
jgi:hypothetical protein